MSFDSLTDSLSFSIGSHPIVSGIALGIIVFLCVTVLTLIFDDSPSIPAKKMTTNSPKRDPIDFSPESLRPFNGRQSDSNPESLIYVSVKGDVFDTSSGASFYGPSGPYGIFAGHDATIALAKGDLTREFLDKDLSAVELTDAERSSLDEWHSFFSGKYEKIGRLISSNLTSASSSSDPMTSSSHMSAAVNELNLHADEQESDAKAESASSSESSAPMCCPYAGAASSSADGTAASKPTAQPRSEVLHRDSLPLFTLDQLARFDGQHSDTQNGIYVAIQGLVFDVTSGSSAEYYGCGGQYEALAGRDATIALAKNSFDGNLCNVGDMKLSEDEQKTVDEHFKQFVEKYPIVGRIESSPAVKTENTFNLEQLHQHSASSRSSTRDQIYISVRGQVYDVSRGADFLPGGRLSMLTGFDVSRALAKQSSDPALFNARFDDLDFDEVLQLESWTRQLQGAFPTVGFVVNWDPVESMRAMSKPKLFTTNLHTHLDQGDVEAVRAALAADPSLSHSVCVRTGLQPLHKAVEAGDAALVKLLLDHGADRLAPAPLYDNETPVDMARRFGQPDILSLLDPK